MKRIAVLGSTGSIGQNTLKIARHLGLKVAALAAGSNSDLLEKQIQEFHPELVALYDESKALELKKRHPNLTVLSGMEGLVELAKDSSSNFVVSAIAGTLGLAPTVAAIQAKKTIGLANKEVLVSAGDLVMQLVKEMNATLLPIDSEHSAIFQCLQDKNEPKRLILTSSGGPFRTFSKEQLTNVSVKDALNHPTWSMGKKVTIDSSTLMNKGLEVIEAYWLFSLPLAKINVVVHPQSIIHSMVEFHDHSILAQMGEPTMLTPIQYALTYPERKQAMIPPFDFTKSRQLDFYPVDLERFKCLSLAYESIREGGSLPCYMNAANEVIVERFLQGEISWTSIGEKLERLMEKHQVQACESIEAVIEIDTQARLEAKLI